MKILFIGGTGNISSACTRLAADRGIELFLLHRSSADDLPSGITQLIGDIRNPAAVKKLLTSHRFDAVVDWIAFEVDHIETDLELFGGKTDQFVFISSASAYQKPPAHYLISESTPLYNPYWTYSQKKIACEQRLLRAYREADFPVTIVRPSYTYGGTWIPTAISQDYTILDRMRSGKEILVHGDGQSLWTNTHNSDFAAGFVPLLGNVQAIGESFHITSDEVLTWDQIYNSIGRIGGVEPRLVHVSSEHIARIIPEWGPPLLGDKACSMVFDNSKIKRVVPGFQALVPFAEGVGRSIRWLDSHPEFKKVDPEVNEKIDRVLQAFA